MDLIDTRDDDTLGPEEKHKEAMPDEGWMKQIQQLVITECTAVSSAEDQ